ncbi:type IX secretion system membrane protein PorP/SprF [Flavobacterium succinicans]|uniref:Type IX secretion system membrane protein, PorP/SprF family n=1 Tax=Flavobacterium succinicans TaxID=29536 RepID=A0A199XRX3_9FLAO|nr:type IX secretion system membrane protein PorP/SprF [Flavobacterium succinicans]OAZ04508.1 hypothetical protein FLB_10920 [Flavobacterium succinicans]
MFNVILISKRLVFLGLIFFVSFECLYAQQEPQFTQYMYATSTINPAYAGSRDLTEISALYRAQWVGIDGAPKTANVNFTMPMYKRMGLGLSVLNDRIGPSDESTFGLDFSYNIDVSSEYRLFFGLKASVNLLNIDFSKLNIENPNDQAFQNNVDNKFSPNIGTGLYLQSEKSFVGLSIPFLLETEHYKDQIASKAKEKMHLYLTAGYVFDLNYNIQFKPSVLFKAVEGSPIQTDVSASFLFNDFFTIGAAYRSKGEGVSALAGFQVSNNLYIGYGYDFSSSGLTTFGNSSHELFLRFSIFDFKNSRIVSPRFF